jgi:hypothetical protein
MYHSYGDTTLLAIYYSLFAFYFAPREPRGTVASSGPSLNRNDSVRNRREYGLTRCPDICSYFTCSWQSNCVQNPLVYPRH